MANEITTFGHDDSAHVRREFNERDLRSIPGRYFRTVAAIPERTETALKKISRWDRGDHTADSKEVSYSARRAVREGITLLAVRLHFLDDALHSVEMAPHPEDRDRDNLVFMAEEFFTFFIADEEGEQVRAGEIAAVQSRIVGIQERLAAPPPSVAGYLAAPMGKAPAATDLVRVLDHKDNIAERTQALAVQAEEHMKFLQEGTEEINAHTALLANFYKEKAVAAVAQVGDQIQYAKDLKEGLKTLSLYTGEGVWVKTVCTGESADPSEPLTLYQARLYFDEELAVDTLVGGFDHARMGDLAEILQGDGSLIERMIPAKRGAVLVRVRRSDKEYFDSPTMALANAFANMANQLVYLLVRDGGNVHLVHSEITTDNAERLFPTRKEIDDIFHRFDREIRPEHLDYSKAKNDFERMTVFYKRMLLMLWGLNDRMNLFGDFYDRSTFNNWYDEEFQARRIAYVYDGEGTLEVLRPSFLEWIEENNRLMQSGSRIAAVWHRMINTRSAPACYSNRYTRGEPARLYNPTAVFGIALVERNGGSLVTKCEVSAVSWMKARRFDARVDLAYALRDDLSACICIDRVKVADLDYYLNSRKERRYYLEYFHLFKELRKFLAEEEETQRTAIDSMKADFAHAGLAADVANDALERAVVLWRAQNGGMLVGGDGWTDKARTTVLDIAFALSGKQSDLLERARRDIPGIVPIEVRVDGRANFWLYREPQDSEVTELERKLNHAFVTKVRLRIGKTRVSESGEPRRVYLANPGFVPRDILKERSAFSPVREETVVADAAMVEKWKDRSLPAWTSLEDMETLGRAASHDGKAILSALDVDDLEHEIVTAMNSDKSGYVATTAFVLPLGIAAFRHSEEGMRLLYLRGNGIDVLASLGKLGLQTARALVNRRYKKPEDRLSRLEETVSRLSPGMLPLKLCHVDIATARWAADGPRVVLARILPDGEIGATVYRAFGGSKNYPTIEGSLFGSFGRYSNDKPEDMKVVWLHEGNKELAEQYFEATKEKPKEGE